MPRSRVYHMRRRGEKLRRRAGIAAGLVVSSAFSR